MYIIQAAQEFGLLLKNVDISSSFEQRLISPMGKSHCVLHMYCKNTQIKCSAIQSETMGYCDEMQPGKVTFFLFLIILGAKPGQVTQYAFCMASMVVT